MTRLAHRWMASLAVVAAMIAVVTTGITYSAFSSATTGAGNRFDAGTVALGDNDTDTTMLALTDAQPGATDTSCIAVTYEGSLPAEVRLRATASGAMASYIQLTVTRGTDATPAFDACTGFVADQTDYLGLGSGVVYSGTLASYPNAWASAIVDPPSGQPETWTTGEAHLFRVSVTLLNDVAAEGTSASAAFTWEARNE